MTPEISHRCRSCGAAVREADALFCPDCGKPLRQEAEATAGSDSRGSAIAPEPAASDPGDSETPPPASGAAPSPRSGETNVAPSPRRGEKTRDRLHRASAVARGVVEGEVKRVEKIRHVSTTIVEEASYDPSLRFVLVAMGLFVVFVILLILSKVMG